MFKSKGGRQLLPGKNKINSQLFTKLGYASPRTMTQTCSPEKTNFTLWANTVIINNQTYKFPWSCNWAKNEGKNNNILLLKRPKEGRSTLRRK